jgi:D-alanine-D-alanine ligase
MMDDKMSGPHVILLFGGRSAERRVSVASAQNLCTVLPEAALWMIQEDGAVCRCPKSALLAHARPFEIELVPETSPDWPSLPAALARCERSAVFFLGLHGGEGEDGRIQALLEDRGLAFTGSGATASAAAFDKQRAKEIVARHGVGTPEATVVESGAATLEHTLRDLLEQRGPLIAKPVAEGSSIGLYRLDSEADIGKIASEIGSFRVPYLIEDRVSGRELTVGVLDEGEECLALPPSEVCLDGTRTFDYAGKYLGRGTREITPAQVPVEVTREAQRIAVLAHRALGCEGYSRTDLIVRHDALYYLETNTLPGLTRASFIPQQLAAAERSLQEFVASQVQLAIARRDRPRG